VFSVQSAFSVHVRRLFNIYSLIVIMLNSYGECCRLLGLQYPRSINDLFRNWLLQLGRKERKEILVGATFGLVGMKLFLTNLHKNIYTGTI
jgi:hypothetical protein